MMSAALSNETVDTKAKYNRNARLHDLFEFITEVLVYSYWRKELFKMMKGDKFLEIGVGTGKNLRYYPTDANATAIDFSEGMLLYAKRRAAKMGQNVTLKNMDVQNLQFGANSFPNILATFVFCSVPDPVRGMKEVRRVCISNGRFVLLEHVRPKNTWLGKLFDRLNHIVVKCTGVNINRDTAENIRKAGFEIELERNLLGNVFKLFVARPVKLTRNMEDKESQKNG